MDECLVKELTDLVLRELCSTRNTKKSVEAGDAVPVGVSARHVHLCREHVDMLFGKGYTLQPKKELMGGQYAAEEYVTIVGTKLRAIENVRILGPERSKSQVEVAKTDAIKLGVNPPVRESGNIKGSAAIALVGPKGAVYLEEGCIIAKRHIHMTPSHAQAFHVCDGDLVDIRFENDRGGVMEDVLIRVGESFTLEMHIDTDEANGLGVISGDMGRVSARSERGTAR